METSTFFVDQLKKVVGQKVKEVRLLTADEREDFDFSYADPAMALALIFDDGTALVPLQDPEGNGPGYIEVLTTVRR